MSEQNIKKIKRVEFILLMVYSTPLNSSEKRGQNAVVYESHLLISEDAAKISAYGMSS